jgi:hypothetical protein
MTAGLDKESGRFTPCRDRSAYGPRLMIAAAESLLPVWPQRL